MAIPFFGTHPNIRSMNTTALLRKARNNRRKGNYAGAIRAMAELNNRLRAGVLTKNQRNELNREAKFRANMK